uniref:Uncharacterized protein n=1 Tax=Oryza nivara TaxID=4536 RepID=A0A0E0FS34_ORYNI
MFGGYGDLVIMLSKLLAFLVVEFFLAKIHMGEIHKFLSFGLLVGQRHVNRKAQRYKCNGKSSKDW